MAKYWEHLKKHPDDIKKHKITETEIQFLKKLQEEMNTQDHVGQADPRYWVIRDYNKVYGNNLNNPDGIVIYDSDSCSTLMEIEYQFFGVDEVIKEILKRLEEDEYELSEEAIENIKLAYDLSSLAEYLKEIEEYEFTIMEYQEIPVDKGIFFTHDAAEQHLKSNEHHYCDHAHTYAHTAWRSKEEHLWHILQTVDFEQLN